MIFNSYIFILVFLPLCITGYYFLNRKKWYNVALTFVTLMSLWFYGYFNPKYLTIIISSVCVNFLTYKALTITVKMRSARRFILLFGLIFNLGLLGYFKYTEFIVKNANIFLGTDFVLRKIILPLGISFFTFQQISFLLDFYRSNDGDAVRADGCSFIEYATYVTFFPQLVAGPIVTYDILVPQFKDRSRKDINFKYIVDGLILFTLGMSKKVLMADVLGSAVNTAWEDIEEINTITAIAASFGYTFQIYFDFSGYSDMAIGLAKMLNIDLPNNFISPYKSHSVTEFWKRWHITLTSFFTKYVYIPLGGSRKGAVRTYLNVIIVFLLSGLWHGAGWNYILWGAMHGIAQVIERIFVKSIKRTPHTIVGRCLTFIFVNACWILFRASSISDAQAYYMKILKWESGGVLEKFRVCFIQPEWSLIGSTIGLENGSLSYIFLSVYMVLAFVIAFALPRSAEITEVIAQKKWASIMVSVLMGWCIISFTGISPFLYFNF